MKLIYLIKEIKIYLKDNSRYSALYYFEEVEKSLNSDIYDDDYILNVLSSTIEDMSGGWLNIEDKLHIKSLIRNYKLELLDI